MKKIIFLSLVLVLELTSLNSCMTPKSTTSAVSDVLQSKVSASLVSSMTPMLLQAGLGNLAGNLNLGTQLNTIIKDAQMVSTFKNLIATKYQIPLDKIEKSYSGFNTLNNVVSFIGTNASSSILSAL